MKLRTKLSIKTKLVLAFVGSSGGLIFILTVLAAIWYGGNQLRQMDVFLNTEANGIDTALSTYVNLDENGSNGNPEPLKDPDFSKFLSSLLVRRIDRPISYQTTLLVTDSKDHLISVSNQALNLNPDSLISHSALIYAEKHIGKDSSLFSVRYERWNYRVLRTPIELNGAFVGSIYLACLLDPVTQASKDFSIYAAMLFLAFLLINGFGGAFFVSRILDPVRKMSDAMNRVTENNLSARLDILSEDDELGMLAATFNHTLDRIEKAYRSQGQLVSDLSHQLRTPLTSIRGAVELGMQKARSIGDYQAILENNIADIDRITSLVNTMLTFARLDGLESLHYAPCDLLKLLEETIGELAPLWEEKSIRFNYCYRYYQNHRIQEFRAEDTLSPRVPELLFALFMIDADAPRFKQAIVNILDNAYKHVPKGGKISIELYREVTGDARICRLVIMNSGSSIPVDTLPLLFTPFFQGEPSQPRDNNPKAELVEANVRGFGLGLSICRRIVAMHRGKIRAFNPVTGGAAFEIILPITQSDRIVYDRKERYQADAPYDGDR
ncbi:MAG TPA: hypothetical protein DCY05_01285 [Spirochaetaceae bacterium]|nr:hypothetical protein [Spirochaetaceae bacterium]HCQ86378.1 hypothetical protein [Spirochaetaceae bacterium]